ELFFWYRDSYFSTKIDFCSKLTPIGTERDSQKFQEIFGKYEPSFFMKWSVEGYQLGIEVDEAWWKIVKPRCPSVLKEERKPLTGDVELVLAVIPYAEFGVYWEGIDDSSSVYHDWIHSSLSLQKKQREKFGWTCKEREPGLPSMPEI